MESDDLASKIRNEYLGVRFSRETFISWIVQFLESAADLDRKEYYYKREIKKVREEGYPIALFLKANLLDVRSIEPSAAEHARYDAILTLNDSRRFFLEVTSVKDGEFEKIRAKHLDKFGRAPVNGISKEELLQALQSGEEAWGDAVAVDEAVDACVSGIQARLEDKFNKRYESPSILLVAFEDGYRASAFKSICDGVFLPSEIPFSMLFLVSIQSRNCHRKR